MLIVDQMCETENLMRNLFCVPSQISMRAYQISTQVVLSFSSACFLSIILQLDWCLVFVKSLYLGNNSAYSERKVRLRSCSKCDYTWEIFRDEFIVGKLAKDWVRFLDFQMTARESWRLLKKLTKWNVFKGIEN